MTINNLIQQATHHITKNSPIILTAAGVTGVATTAYLAAKGSFKAARMIDAVKNESHDPKERIKNNIKLVWPCYVPAVLSGTVTVGAILLSHKVDTSRTAAAVSAYSITEKAFTQYKDKVVEEIGQHKEQIIVDDIAQEQVEKNPPGKNNLVIAGSGDVLCCERYTGRYFNSTMETLRKAQNDINQEIVNHLYVPLDSFYDMVKLPSTAHSSEMGWDSYEFLEFKFSTVMTEDGRPCLAFDYNYVKPI